MAIYKERYPTGSYMEEPCRISLFYETFKHLQYEREDQQRIEYELQQPQSA